MQVLNEAKIHETWSPIIESQTGIKDREKLNWLSKYCHYHTLNESTAYATLGATPGMGGVATGATLGTGSAGFYTGATGSGDKFPSLLPLAIQVAAKTVGFDIVNVIPMSGPAGVLTYLDYVYAGGTIGGAVTPDVIEINAGLLNAGTVGSPAYTTAYVVGTTYWGLSATGNDTNLAGNVAKLTYVGKSRISGFPIFRVIAMYTADGSGAGLDASTTVTIANVFDGGAYITTNVSSAPSVELDHQTAVITAYATLVNALENHVHGFSGAGPTDGDAWSGDLIDGTKEYEPMSRGTGESTYYRVMGLKAYTKFVEATTYQVAASITTEQIQDLNRQYGIDVVAMVENALVNEITQSINKHILARAFALGWSNNDEFETVMGDTLNFSLSTTPGSATVSYIGKAGTSLSVPVNGFYLVNGTGFENLSTVQRRVVSKILAAGNIIASRGRRGPANFVVTNAHIATALSDVAQFTFAPMANTINQNNGSLYPIGTLAGMTVYVDPNMEWTDTRVLVGRKGTDEEPGLKFMPYLMAEPIQTISEGTMSPKIAVKSRYALVEAGQLPQTMYYTFYVELNGNTLV